MRIGEVAAEARVNEETLRFYEREGLLRKPPRSPNGYRDYPPDTVALVRFIKRAQELGFTLGEARELSDLRHAPGRNRLKVRALAEAKIRDVEQRIADLSAIKTALGHLIGSCCHNTEPRCPILEALGVKPERASTPNLGRTTS